MRPVVLFLLAVAALLGGCDAFQSQALKAYMSVNKGLEVEDGTVAVAGAGQAFEINALLDDLEFPWGMNFLPDGRLLVTEKPGRLRIFDPASGDSVMLDGLPEVHHKGQGGLLDVLPHPDFERNNWLYLSAAIRLEAGQHTTQVLRYRLDGSRLTDKTLIFQAEPVFDGSLHFGSALVFGNDGHLYITMGDRRRRDHAQDLDTSLGKVLRVTEDGGIPADNPFVSTPGALPAIYTYGHRNPQGITIDRATGRIWSVEHGPQGGDEINLLVPGTNYGWPVITYGEEYGGGKIGEGTHKEGMAQPVQYYVPSIATGGIAWYDAEALPAWRGSLFVAGLRSFSLSRVTLDGDKAVAEERLLEDFSFRIRDVAQGPDGLLYILTENGGLHRVGPVARS